MNEFDGCRCLMTLKLLAPPLFLSLALGTIANPVAAQNNLPPEVREMARKVMMPVVYKVPGMDKVKVVQNLKYTKTDDPNVLMDVYLPPDVARDEKRPAVIFIHGGAKTEYTPKDWGIFTTWGRLVAASGFVGVTFTHSLEYPGKSLERGARDVRAAIDYVRANADKYNIDKDRICLIAYSAGGPMLSLAMNGEMPFVRCLIGFYAFMDIQLSDYRKTETPETLKAFSPITYLQKDPAKIPLLFIGRAGRDEVPTMDDSIDRFVKEALAKDVALTLANHPQGVHSFDNQNDDDRSREIIRDALAFMHIHLNAARQEVLKPSTSTMTEPNDFDFFIGNWRVHHRRLKERLVHNDDWEEFEGTSTVQKILGGLGNMDENVIELPSGTYRAATVRTYDPAKQLWTIWWIDSRNPGHLDPPVLGSFEKGVGTFYADDEFKGKPIRVRYLWNQSSTPHWEQAFSDDKGKTWETNWIMDFTRAR